MTSIEAIAMGVFSPEIRMLFDALLKIQRISIDKLVYYVAAEFRLSDNVSIVYANS